MTKDEALAAMQAGKKITHTYFTRSEFLHIVDGRMISEDGVPFDEEWLYRDRDPVWSNGWSEWV